MKSAALQAVLARYETLAVAYSGGVDSTFLAYAAAKTLGRDRVLLLLADSILLPRAEYAAAVAWARNAGLRLQPIPLAPLTLPAVAANTPMRCYHCKKHLMQELQRIARLAGYDTVADGSNCDDCADYRPGMKACDEVGITHPLLAAGLTKQDIRTLAHAAGLPNWQAPAAACLASRIPTGTPLTPELLLTVERAEAVLHELGFPGIRVRHLGTQLKLELRSENDWPRLIELRPAIVARLRPLGIEVLTVDLAGYRMGAMNRPDAPVPGGAAPAAGH